jgi:LacI family transcriptional regulator
MANETIQDVALRAEVSIKTVSRVLNREPGVRKETRERVQQAIDALHYRPDPAARRLASNRSYLIGLLYDNPSPSYVINNQVGVLSQCQSNHYDLLIHPCDYLDPGLCDEVVSFIRQTRLDGVILTPPLSDQDALVRRLADEKVAFTCIGRGNPGPCIARVITNDEDASCALMKHLIELGHRAIGFIKGHPDHQAVQFRELGYLRALAEAGIEFQPEFVVQGYNSFESGLQCAHELLDSDHRPTAIFAANDDMASGVIKAAYELGIKVPTELSVAGFDDVPLAGQVSPGLTTVRQPIREMAELAADILLHNIAGKAVEKPGLCIESEIVFRDSTAPPPGPGTGELKLRAI